MPLYEYHCSACDHEFSDILKVSERHTPIDNDCPNCDSRGHIQIKISAAKIVSGVGSILSKTPSGFKDILNDIKKHQGRGCTIET